MLFGSHVGNDVIPSIFDVGEQVPVLRTGSDDPRYSSSPDRNHAVFVLSQGIGRSHVLPAFLLRPLSHLGDVAEGSRPGRNGLTLFGLMNRGVNCGGISAFHRRWVTCLPLRMSDMSIHGVPRSDGDIL